MDAKGIFDTLAGLAQASGVFNSVLTHEPKSAPQLQDQVTLALWASPMRPIDSSGLASVSMRWDISGRIFYSAFQEPVDEIDSRLMSAAGTYLAALCANFTLGGLVRNVDIFGQEGDRLEAVPGYLEQDKKIFRVVDLRIPLLLNDEYPEVP